MARRTFRTGTSHATTYRRTGTMIDRIGQAVAAADSGDFEVNKARYRRLAIVALKPLTRPSEAMVDGAYQAVQFDDYWAINGRSDFKKAAKAMITFAMRECER